MSDPSPDTRAICCYCGDKIIYSGTPESGYGWCHNGKYKRGWRCITPEPCKGSEVVDKQPRPNPR